MTGLDLEADALIEVAVLVTDSELNVLGEPLQPCSDDPLTGFFRDGHCHQGQDGSARHLVCIEASAEFLAFSKSVGNDLSTPRPEMAFPGLRPGDRCASSHRAGPKPNSTAWRHAWYCCQRMKGRCATPTSRHSRLMRWI